MLSTTLVRRDRQLHAAENNRYDSDDSLLLPFIKTVDKTQLHMQNSNSRIDKIQQSVFTHNSLSINNLNDIKVI